PHANVVFHDGSDPYRMHNQYAFLYNKLVFELLEERFGKGEAVVFARSAAAGGQRFVQPQHWGGDCESTFEAMAETLRGGLSLTLSGFAFTSHDIGGFEGLPPPEIYLRWVAYGLFSSHSRLHGSNSYRVPWEYGEDTPKVLAKFVETKHRLMPYLFYHAIQGHLKGHPMQRAMWVDFFQDRTTLYLDRQFMVGPSILVAPVFVPSNEESEYYLPAGKWTCFWTGRTIAGPKWVSEIVALDDIPVWIKQGSIILLGPEKTKKPDYDYSQGLTVRVYELEEGQTAEARVPIGKGTEITGVIRAERLAGDLKIQVVEGRVQMTTVELFIKGVEIRGVVGDVSKTEKGRYKVKAGTTAITFKL
ncbi:glycoside hydrolase family 31 protein, partial [Sphaerobolus stellatus SS14]